MSYGQIIDTIRDTVRQRGLALKCNNVVMVEKCDEHIRVLEGIIERNEYL